MKIKRIACEQFAGLLDQELDFADGLNVVVGENESGKSTIAELLYQTLFQKPNLDGRTDADFIDRFFPKNVSGKQGNVIDGSVRFETEEGVYRLEKEWEKSAGLVKLRTPEGDVIKGKEAEELLSKELIFGRGIYDEIVFSSQKRRLRAVELLLKDAKGRKKSGIDDELRSNFSVVLSQAAMETGGVSVDKLEKKLEEMKTRYGARWDFRSDLPEGGVKRGISNKWRDATTKEADAGQQAIILRAWYDMKEIEDEQQKALAAEQIVENEKKALRDASEEKRKLSAERKRFQEFRSALETQTLLANQISMKRDDLAERRRVRDRLPVIERDLSSAVELQKRIEQAELRDHYFRAKTIADELQEGSENPERLAELPAEAVKRAEQLLREQELLKAKLSGLNVSARVQALSDASVEVTTAGGAEIAETDGVYEITEAAKIAVSGVVEITLMPKGVELNAVNESLEKGQEELTQIFRKYGVASVEELREKRERYEELLTKRERLQEKFTQALEGEDWEELKKKAAALPETLEPLAVYQEQKTALCGTKPLDRLIGELEAEKAQYESKYTSPEELQSSILKLEQELADAEAAVRRSTEIPEELQQIENPKEYAGRLEEQFERLEDRVEELRASLSEAERNLRDQSAEEYADALRAAREKFEASKVAYRHWIHIAEVFDQVRASFGGTNTDDFANQFREYLSALTEDAVKLSALDTNFESTLASGNHALTYEILSEGTRDTISLAFRLAMLSSLYPDGGGLAVFDDPFTEMDEKRTKRSCALLKEFAKKHQIIFITCDSKYEELLGGEILRVKR